MRKIEIGITSLRDAATDFVRSVKAVERGARIRKPEQLLFEDMSILLKTLTSERWRILEQIKAQGPCSAYAVAQRVGRNYKNVHGDIRLLAEIGLVTRLDDGKYAVPYDSIIAELKMAA